MKKTFKKLTAILLVSIMLIASVPMQSFAGFDNFRIPIIKSIEFGESPQSISLKELDNYYTMLFEAFEEDGITLESLTEKFPLNYDTILNFYFSSSNFEYEFDITLFSGKKYTVSSEYASVKLNKTFSLEIDAFITYDTYLEAKEKGSDEIEVNLCGYLYNNRTYDYFDAADYTSKTTLPLKSMIVKNITPLSGIPDKLYADSDYIDIDGAEFLIEYADGTVTTSKAVRTSDADDVFYDNYTLDGNELFVWTEYDYDEETDKNIAEYCFEYLDAYFKTSAEFVETSLFKSVKITDCDFDVNTAVLKSISYELTYEDGRVLSFTKDLSEEEVEMLVLGKEINFIDGYIVYVYLTVGGFDVFSEKINVDTIDIELSIGENSDVYKTDIPHKDIINGMLNVYFFFVNIIEKIQNIIDFIFFFNFDMKGHGTL
ncbi:MAG: hypothetical protein IJ349_11525 [Clostridia bacterium]|nr:hypothetical protein [Clostridia bacterium]MBQ7862813.1 hypothetical protein [Clostridia bacterium]